MDPASQQRIPRVPDYELVRLIGRGSYGDVWLARGITGALRAVKLVWRDRFPDARPYAREFEGITRFSDVSLREPLQLALLHAGRNEEAGFFYYVMELADDAERGREIDPATYVPLTLKELRARREHVPPTEAITLGVALARALANLHAAGLVHRDIKPSNVVLVGGAPKFADVGLVATAGAELTYVGTEGYVPPEGPGAPAADVYALGKVLYELATGLDRQDYPRLPPNLSNRADHRTLLQLNEVLVRACDPHPAQRYPDAAAMLADLLVLEAGRPVRRTHRFAPILWIAAATTCLLGVLAGGAWLWFRAPAVVEVVAPRLSPKSIAVLPFTNLGEETDHGFLAAGVHEDIINGLVKIRDLKVISRTSVMAYRNGTRNLKKIAADLGVGSVLEGSVQRDGDKVLVIARLIDATTDHLIWSERYPCDLTNVFALQSTLAEEITGRLRATFTPAERNLVSTRPTLNAEAYELYLRARTIDQDLGYEGSLADHEQAVELYQRAIAKDPNFALAQAQLSMLQSSLYWNLNFDRTPARLARARAAADEAFRLAPDAPETHLARGALHYRGSLDWASAIRELQAAEAGLPNDEQLLTMMGLAQRRLGRWHEALDCVERAAKLNPRDVRAGTAFAQQLYFLHRYAEATTAAEKFAARSPNVRLLAHLLVYVRYEADGDRVAFLQGLNALPPAPGDPERVLDRYYAALQLGDFAAAEQALTVARRVLPDPLTSDVLGSVAPILPPLSLTRAQLAFLRHAPADSRLLADQALVDLRKGSWSPRQQPWVLMGIARAEAFAGRAEDAMQHAREAWRQVAERDQFDAAIMRIQLGYVYLTLGRNDDALGVLRDCVSGPGDLGPQELRHDPMWSRLKDDPRFEEILHAVKRL